MSDIQHQINAAMSLFNAKKYTQLINDFANKYSQHPMLTMLFAIALGKDKQYKKSFSILKKLHANFPKNLDVLHNYALLLNESGDATSAIAKHKETVSLNPQYDPAHFALGQLLMTSGQFEAAASAHTKAFNIRPCNAHFEGLVSALLSANAYVKCIELILANQRFLSQQPVAECFFEACHRTHNRQLIRQYYPTISAQHQKSYLVGLYAGLSELEAKRYIFSRDVLSHALQVCSDNARSEYEIRSNLYYVSWLIDNDESSFTRLEEYLLADNNDQSLVFLHKIYEGMGKLDQAQELLSEASLEYQESPDGRLALANVLFRQSKFTEADAILEKLTQEQSQMLSAHYLRIRVSEKQQNFAQAAAVILQVESINKQASSLFVGQVQSELSLSEFTQAPSKSVNVSSHTAKFIFIVGFPRSGTTLLEKELLSAKDVVLMEETDACASFFEQTAQRLCITDWQVYLASVQQEELNELANDYLVFLSSFVNFAPNTQVLLDKMPLNFPYLPLMLALFPCSKVLCCVRDPRDIALSCLKFEELNIYSSREFYLAYDKVFNYAQALMPLFPQAFQNVRYEDLVADVKATMQQLFITLDLQRGTADDNVTLLQTPSYHQVSQPVYKTSVGLFEAYTEFIDFADPLLDKWLQHWDYS